MDKKTTWIIVVIILVVIIALAVWRVNTDPTTYEQIVVGDNELVITPFEEGEDFVVDHVELATPGYIVIWANNDPVTRTEEDVLGVSELLPAGSHDNVRITRNNRGTVHGGSSVVVAVHYDDGDETFEVSEDAVGVTEEGVELSTEVPVIEEEVVEEEMSNEEESSEQVDETSSETETAPAPTTETSEEETSTSTPTEEAPDDTTNIPAPTTLVITYTDNGFQPATITIKEGDTVEFVNKSAGLMWVASDEHPTHDELPGFDQEGDAGFNGVYDYTFRDEGTWEFHNHREPEHGGTIVVQDSGTATE